MVFRTLPSHHGHVMRCWEYRIAEISLDFLADERGKPSRTDCMERYRNTLSKGRTFGNVTTNPAQPPDINGQYPGVCPVHLYKQTSLIDHRTSPYHTQRSPIYKHTISSINMPAAHKEYDIIFAGGQSRRSFSYSISWLSLRHR